MRPPKDFPANTAEWMRFLLRRAKDIASERGERVHRLSPKCNTAARSLFLLDLLDAWPDEPRLLVLVGPGWHKARSLPVPERLRL